MTEGRGDAARAGLPCPVWAAVRAQRSAEIHPGGGAPGPLGDCAASVTSAPGLRRASWRRRGLKVPYVTGGGGDVRGEPPKEDEWPPPGGGDAAAGVPEGEEHAVLTEPRTCPPRWAAARWPCVPERLGLSGLPPPGRRHYK